jgi:hypothetical protein
LEYFVVKLHGGGDAIGEFLRDVREKFSPELLHSSGSNALSTWIVSV